MIKSMVTMGRETHDFEEVDISQEEPSKHDTPRYSFEHGLSMGNLKIKSLQRSRYHAMRLADDQTSSQICFGNSDLMGQTVQNTNATSCVCSFS